MKLSSNTKFSRLLHRAPGIMSLKPFRLLTTWWPIFTIIVYGSYIWWPEARQLGAAAPVWIAGRTIIVLVSIAALIWQKSPLFRELLGHAMLAYAAGAVTSYYLAIPVRNGIFWGSVIRIIGVSLMSYALAISSYLALNTAEGKRILEVSDKDLEEVI